MGRRFPKWYFSVCFEIHLKSPFKTVLFIKFLLFMDISWPHLRGNDNFIECVHIKSHLFHKRYRNCKWSFCGNVSHLQNHHVFLFWRKFSHHCFSSFFFCFFIFFLCFLFLFHNSFNSGLSKLSNKHINWRVRIYREWVFYFKKLIWRIFIFLD